GVAAVRSLFFVCGLAGPRAIVAPNRSSPPGSRALCARRAAACLSPDFPLAPKRSSTCGARGLFEPGFPPFCVGGRFPVVTSPLSCRGALNAMSASFFAAWSARDSRALALLAGEPDGGAEGRAAQVRAVAARWRGRALAPGVAATLRRQDASLPS